MKKKKIKFYIFSFRQELQVRIELFNHLVKLNDLGPKKFTEVIQHLFRKYKNF